MNFSYCVLHRNVKCNLSYFNFLLYVAFVTLIWIKDVDSRSRDSLPVVSIFIKLHLREGVIFLKFLLPLLCTIPQSQLDCFDIFCVIIYLYLFLLIAAHFVWNTFDCENNFYLSKQWFSNVQNTSFLCFKVQWRTFQDIWALRGSCWYVASCGFS